MWHSQDLIKFFGHAGWNRTHDDCFLNRDLSRKAFAQDFKTLFIECVLTTWAKLFYKLCPETSQWSSVAVPMWWRLLWWNFPCGALGLNRGPVFIMCLLPFLCLPVSYFLWLVLVNAKIWLHTEYSRRMFCKINSRSIMDHECYGFAKLSFPDICKFLKLHSPIQWEIQLSKNYFLVDPMFFDVSCVLSRKGYM